MEIGWGAPAACSLFISMETVTDVLSEPNCVAPTSRQGAKAVMVSIVTSRVRGVASPGVVA